MWTFNYTLNILLHEVNNATKSIYVCVDYTLGLPRFRFLMLALQYCSKERAGRRGRKGGERGVEEKRERDIDQERKEERMVDGEGHGDGDVGRGT